MKKWITPILVVGAIVLWLISGYNGLVTLRNNAETAWSKVESSYQRRNDLIGNLVKTVQGAAEFEKSTLTDVINARAKATSVNINAGDLTPDKMAQFQQAQSGLSGALSKLLVSVERYPDLKANRNFLELQSQLEGTENRINVERNRYNDSVNIYDTKVDRFPGVLLASIFGFKQMPRYKSDPGSEKAPDVNFKF
ncbi:LemA family protein [Tenacibaculum sp. M341]|uniref:LemA family protein n=1 Tax=Tenacibaculum sp. M341 TaxID=2530339 RepID=UPI001042AE93|nr:LemA family protein [Tenacibaculum sp. M341]TCI93542.1 LemA family protein [Tenacibaculum sp. M341]